MVLRSLIAVVGLCFSTSVFSELPNTVAAGAVTYEVGQGWVNHAFDESTQDRWFIFQEQAGRSYCIEAVQGSASYFTLDPNLTLYQDVSGLTPLQANEAAQGESMLKGARICYIASTNGSDVRAIKVNVPIEAGSEKHGFVKLRVIETTYISKSYQSFSTDFSNGSTTVNLFNVSGSVVRCSFYIAGGSKLATEVSVQPHSSYSRRIDPVRSTSAQGTLLMAHDGPPGAFQSSSVIVNTGNYVSSGWQYKSVTNDLTPRAMY